MASSVVKIVIGGCLKICTCDHIAFFSQNLPLRLTISLMYEKDVDAALAAERAMVAVSFS